MLYTFIYFGTICRDKSFEEIALAVNSCMGSNASMPYTFTRTSLGAFMFQMVSVEPLNEEITEKIARVFATKTISFFSYSDLYRPSLTTKYKYIICADTGVAVTEKIGKIELIQKEIFTVLKEYNVDFSNRYSQGYLTECILSEDELPKEVVSSIVKIIEKYYPGSVVFEWPHKI